ncbi:hypothetical protein [Flavobacterium sp.]|uniref:hypothetical protein n=1 Tax=Flavobacterium sp. TaxID=239 RepID=UPI003F6A11FA
MKKIIYILTISITFLSCNNQPNKVEEENFAEKETQTNKFDNSKYYTQQDTILIATEIGDTLKYAKIDFNNIVDKHTEFFEDYPKNPDQAYFNDMDKEEFNCEVGQDVYYVLYAYFLKQRNGVEEFAQQRQKLINIYSNINSLFGHFQYGGTYFGHQSSRILGYAEYSIYLLPKSKDDISKTYDITKQKDFYIKSLRQLIEDESKIDFETLGQEKIARNKKLKAIVGELNKLITDNFYLRRAQEFQYGHYEYY